ncbi:MAG: pathogenicity locus [Actinobacteria bacterium]|nr:pathogenicity locus [Actinomycetota bacterium]
MSIPGVGPSISKDLHGIGINKVADLENEDPEDLYARFCCSEGVQVDRCVLYVFRCAVYYATENEHDPELLKWWNWKDRQLK